MKKIILAFFALLTVSAATQAQTSPAKKTASSATTTAPADKKASAKVVPMKAPGASKTATATTVPAKTAATPLKKDGTPDKRFTKNKVTPATPLKKDGTTDMRYKENKPKAKS